MAVIHTIPNCGSGNVLDVGVVDEGDVTPHGQVQIVVDERFNQLDEFDSQLSQSILPNCGPDVALSGGELLSCSQIHTVKESSLSNLSNDKENESEPNLSIGNSSNESSGNINCYGSAILSDGSPPGPPSDVPSFPVDTEMTQASDPRKRPISEVSSDDTIDGCSSEAIDSCSSEAIDSFSSSALSSVPAPKVKGKNKKGSKKSASAASRHLPGNIASAARLAVSRVSVKK